jgi:chaperonin cofactor prefoldin
MAEPQAAMTAPPSTQYRELMQECQQYMQKIAELEVDRNEHSLVEETLKPLDPTRRAYRLIGEVLVERTVEEVLPSVTSNKENVRKYRLNCGGLQLQTAPHRSHTIYLLLRFIRSFTLASIL